MHPLANHLTQLQELTLIRVEQKAHRKGHRLDELDASIAALTAQLPQDLQSLVLRMQKRDHVIIVPVSQGICAGCGMRLPTSLIQAVKVSPDIQMCPTCTRILYFPDASPRNIGQAPRRSEPRKVGISRFSSPTLMIPRMKAVDRDEAIRELAERMQAEQFVDRADRMIEAALRREAVVSTAVDHGLAFPHVRGVEGGGLTLALGLSAKGVRFDDQAKVLSRIVFFMVIPTAASAFYMKLLAGLAETFSDPEARKTLLAAETQDAVWKALVKVTRKQIA